MAAPFDPHINFLASTVAVSPGILTGGGVSLTVAAGTGFAFPQSDPFQPFNCIVYQPGIFPNALNTEIVRVTGITGDTFTITRQAEGSTLRNIEVGDIIAMSITAKCLTDIESAISVLSSQLAALE
jgi:hypothetical protein